jgi:hypothetical protein
LKNLPLTVSFLKAQGHVYADFYPLWRLWMEVSVARRRMNLELANQTMSRYVAMVSATPQSKKGASKAKKLFNDYLKGLTDG